LQEGKKFRFFTLLILLVGLVIIELLAPTFFGVGNLTNLLRQVSINGIIACGMTILLISGGFDLSVGAMLALSGVLSIHFAQQGLFLAMLVPLSIGVLGGCVNGVLVSWFSINPLIVTLGIRYLLYAAANLYTDGFIQYNQNPEFLLIGRSHLFKIPSPGIIFFGIALLSHFVLRYTSIGLSFFAVGSNERAAFFSGLLTRKVRVWGYLASGICAAMAGVVLASRLGVAAPDAGEGYELEAIAAVVVGGTSLFGGSGGIGKTIAGVVLLGILSNLLVLAGQSYEAQRIATGTIIVLAVAVDVHIRKKAV
jgi:ribose/xylose/arabinose/galactoside ABC-type transport system permease subunit